MPSHNHTINIGAGDSGSGAGSGGYFWHKTPSGYNTNYTGGGTAHNHGNTGSTTPGNTGSSLSSTQSIMPPYYTVYAWERVA